MSEGAVGDGGWSRRRLRSVNGARLAGVDEGERVGGESRAVLRAALGMIATHRRPDGTLEIHGRLPDDLGDAVARALERIARELRDADIARGGRVREGGELRADSLMALVLRVTDRR